MSIITPEQLRALAGDPRSEQERLAWIAEAQSALRVAANQIGAVQTMHHEREWRPLDGTYIGGTYCNHCRRPWPCSTYQAVSAMTEPQETRDE